MPTTDSEKSLRAAIASDPLDLAAASVLSDFLQEQGRQEGEVIALLVQAQTELRKITDAEKQFEKIARDRASKHWDPKHIEANVQDSVKYQMDYWNRIGSYIDRAIRTPAVTGMQNHVKVARGYLKNFTSKAHTQHHNTAVLGAPPMSTSYDDSAMARDPHANAALGWLDKAAEASRKSKTAPKGPSVQRRLVDLLRKKFGDKGFTGKQAAETHFEAQKEAGKTPGSVSAKRGMADFSQHTRPILDRVATPTFGYAGIGTEYTLLPNAEQVVDRRTPAKMTDVFKI